jgi:hypothetical protein
MNEPSKNDISKQLFFTRSYMPFNLLKELRVGIFSWNIAGKDLVSTHYVKEICDLMTDHHLDILVFGFQEIVEMKLNLTNLTNVMFRCGEISIALKKKIDEYLAPFYFCINIRNLMGMLQFVYVRSKIVNLVHKSSFKSKEKRFGGKGKFKMGNKGAVICMFDIKNFGRFSFSNCHLVHGFDKVNKRSKNIENILSSISGISL